MMVSFELNSWALAALAAPLAALCPLLCFLGQEMQYMNPAGHYPACVVIGFMAKS